MDTLEVWYAQAKSGGDGRAQGESKDFLNANSAVHEFNFLQTFHF